MKTIRIFLLAFVLCLTFAPSLAGPQSKVAFTARLEPAGARAGEGAQVVLTAKIEPPWHMYSLTSPAGGPIPTSIELAPGKALAAGGKAVQPPPKKEHDAGFNMEVEIFEGTVVYGLPVKVKPGVRGAQKAAVRVRYMVCNAANCLPPETVEVPVAFQVAPGPARADRLKPVTTVPNQRAGKAVPQKQPGGTKKAEGGAPAAAAMTMPPILSGPPGDGFARQVEEAKRRGLLAYLWFSLTMGFLALLTPCVFPMVPITVSFFTKQKDVAGAGLLRGPVAFCIGIIATFTGLGLLMTALFGASGIQNFATNPWINLALAALFVALAANLFGVFEIAMPSWLVSRAHSAGQLYRRANSGTQKSGFTGPLLMGLTFTLTSFTCTVPFVGTLLVTASQGSALYPAVGMLAFSTAFALPFFLLALFPQYLARMPKSGSWLAAVKAVMGFLELAAALKFLSNADLVWQKGLLTRPVFLALWSTIGIIAGLYLLGWLRLPHDAEGARIGWIRRGLGVLAAVAGIYCLAALQGVSLGAFDPYLPPDPYPLSSARSLPRSISASAPAQWMDDYPAALARAKAENRPVFIDFTGVTCTNCRLMEVHMFPRPEVVREFRNFVLVRLYTDRATPGDRRNQELEKRLANTNALPYYVVVSPEGAPLQTFPGLTYDAQEFVGFLRQAQAAATRLAQR
jgi:thiol:disulfide interchange protein